MNGIKTIFLLLVLSQLGACAVMSKNECFNANWEQVGYRVAVDGEPNQTRAYNKREKVCAKHGALADWREFQKGHADGMVDYCQLGNALELGVEGRYRVLEGHVCPENDYPGFREAFRTGYKLHLLRRDVQQSQSTISNLESRRYGYRRDIRSINNQLREDEIDKSQRKTLRYKRQKLRDYIYDIDREIEQCRRRLYREESAERSYSYFLYEDYAYSLSDRYIDPRKKSKSE